MVQGFVTVREAADFLGLSTYSVRRLIEDGEIPALRFGRRGHFRISRVYLMNAMNDEGSVSAEPIVRSTAGAGGGYGPG